MKIFIAGARSIKRLDPIVQKRLFSISQKKHDVLIGDCYGVDTLVQGAYAKAGYRNIKIYASGGVARNNIGNWDVCAISAPSNTKGFDFYRAKDLAMANDADCGFMIWDGESRGTLSNLISLSHQEKLTVVYFAPTQSFFAIKAPAQLQALVSQCSKKAQLLYRTLSESQPEQMSLWD